MGRPWTPASGTAGGLDLFDLAPCSAGASECVDTLLGTNGAEQLLASGSLFDDGTEFGRIGFPTEGSYTWQDAVPLDAASEIAGGVAFINTPADDTACGADTLPVFFAAGTRIRTATGEVAVETLRAGDRVATLSGRGAALKLVLWVGRRRILLAGHPGNDAFAPVRIREGALGPDTPRRDLLVAPDHRLLLEGALVAARLLVDGRAVTVERHLGEILCYLVELEEHDVMLAEGAAAESWVDGSDSDAGRAWAPVLQGGEKLATLRASIARRSPRVSPDAFRATGTG